MDAGVGRLLDRLEERGQAEDTLVIFTADNGMNMGHHGIWGKGNATFPFNLFDTAVKVPFIARWPGHVRAGRVTASMCSHYDIIQTLNELLDLRRPPARRPAGPQLCRRAGERRRGRRQPCGDPGRVRQRPDDPQPGVEVHPPLPLRPPRALSSGPGPGRAGEPGWTARSTPRSRPGCWTGCRTGTAPTPTRRWTARREAVTGFGQMRRPGVYSGGRPVYADSPKYQTEP